MYRCHGARLNAARSSYRRAELLLSGKKFALNYVGTYLFCCVCYSIARSLRKVVVFVELYDSSV